MYFLSLWPISADSAIGVNPAARRSPTKTIEIIPSGRTGIVPESVGSFHTVICSESSAPITYRSGSIGPPVLIAAAVGDGADSWSAMAPGDELTGGVAGACVAGVLGACARLAAESVTSNTVTLEQ